MDAYDKEIEFSPRLKEDINNKLEIVKLFNSLNKAIFKEYYSEMIITYEKLFTIYDRVKSELKLLEDFPDEIDDNAEYAFAIKVFKILFLGENDLNTEQFSKKKKSFVRILNLLKNEMLAKEESQDNINFINEIITNSTFKSFCTTLCKNNESNIYYVACFYVIYLYSKSNSIFLDLFILLLKTEFQKVNPLIELVLEKDFSEENLKKISLDNLINDFDSIYKGFMNYSILYIDQLHLKIKPKNNIFYEDENKEKSNEIKNIEKEKQSINKKNNKKKTKKNKNMESSKINLTAQDIKKEEEDEVEYQIEESQIKESQVKKSQKNYGGKANEKKEIFNEPQLNKIESSNTIESQENIIKNLLEKMANFERVIANNEQQYKEDIANLEQQHKEDIANLDEKIDKLEKQYKEDIDDLKQKLANLEKDAIENSKKYKNVKKSIENLKKNLRETNFKIIDLEQELRLIQIRDPFKNIIDLFCQALKINQEYSYKNKVDEIKNAIMLMKLTEDKRDNMLYFFSKIYYILNIDNFKAHTIDSDKPILSQIFSYIDPSGKLNDLRISLEKGKINALLKTLLLNRINNFNNKKVYFEEEKKTIESVTNYFDLVQ